MSAKAVWTPGRFVWRELSTSRPEDAVRFYGELLGWQAETFDEPGGEAYTILQLDGIPVGGVNHVADGSASRWVPFASVEDVDAAVGAAAPFGAVTTAQPCTVPGFGRLALLKDPHGADLALFRRDEGDPPEGSGLMLGAFAWEELRTPSRSLARAFYNAVLGWGATTWDIRGFGPYSVFGREGRDRAGMAAAPEGTKARWVSHVVVDDLDSAAARAASLGARSLDEPILLPNLGRLLLLDDPIGARFALYQPTSGDEEG